MAGEGRGEPKGADGAYASKVQCRGQGDPVFAN